MEDEEREKPGGEGGWGGEGKREDKEREKPGGGDGRGGED